MKKAIMFDLDGTLINTLPDIAGSMNRVLERCGVAPHPEEEYKMFTGDGALNLTKRALGKRSDLIDTVYRQYREEYARHWRDRSAPYDGIREAFVRLTAAGFLLMVLSNKDDADAKNVVAHYFPDVSFAAVQGRTEGYNVKPDPALADLMLQEQGVNAKDLWYVGDTVTDISCAKNIGAACIAVTWGFQPREHLKGAQPDYLADAPKDMVDIILGKA
ncbi:MAG: HAD family hydrolase [Eubacteriales bacterium]|nr:HAD family hydrolase [Eubacteriales bacterium]MDD4711276.1 HAD family hydrolase [Eubacteriales bacterium]